MTAVAVCNCDDENQTSFISPSHSLPFSSLPFSPRIPLSFCSDSVAKNNEVTPLSRTVPYKNSPPEYSLFFYPHPIFHATCLFLAAPIFGQALSAGALVHTHKGSRLTQYVLLLTNKPTRQPGCLFCVH